MEKIFEIFNIQNSLFVGVNNDYTYIRAIWLTAIESNLCQLDNRKYGSRVLLHCQYQQNL